MHIMFPALLLRVLLVVLLFGVGGCATGSVSVNPYFEMPPERLSKTEMELYNRALTQLKNNQLGNSIDLWKQFLQNNPRSFRGYNNLGMALYSNDQLVPAMKAFETALALEPFDTKIKDNLKRALRFQVTILRENKDYATAIEHLERVKKLTDDPPDKERVALEMEILQDLIYEQVKLANTLEGYEAFVAKYPDNPKNSDEARRVIAKLNPQKPGEFPEMQLLPDAAQRTTESTQEVFVPEPMQSVPALPPVRKESIEIVAETKKAIEEFPEHIQENEVVDFAAEEVSQAPESTVMKRTPKVEAFVDPDMEMKRETSAAPVQESVPTKRVRIITQNAPLRVRAKPDARSAVTAQIPKNSVVPVFQETEKWFQIEYQEGKKGWISKKYSRLVN